MIPSAADFDPDPVDLPSLDAGYFDTLYTRAPDADPWNFARSPYEAAKYAATLSRLPRPRYRSGLEVGCSIGVLTEQLSARIDSLLAVDLSPLALQHARLRCGQYPHVVFEQTNILERTPPGPFELILLSEVAYYWTALDFHRIWRDLARALAPGGQIMLVHWRERVPDYPQTGDQVHEQAATLATETGLAHLGHWVDVKYRMDLWERPV